MRLMLDAAIGLMVLLVLSGLLWHVHRQRTQDDRIEKVQESIVEVQRQAIYRGALGDVEAKASGYAAAIDPSWFASRPINTFVTDPGVPWMDHATEEQRDLLHPKRIVADEQRAAFWYNPYRGIVRARVPMQFTQQSTVELYNRLNGGYISPTQVVWQESDAAEMPTLAVSEADHDSDSPEFRGRVQSGGGAVQGSINDPSAGEARDSAEGAGAGKRLPPKKLSLSELVKRARPVVREERSESAEADGTTSASDSAAEKNREQD